MRVKLLDMVSIAAFISARFFRHGSSCAGARNCSHSGVTPRPANLPYNVLPPATMPDSTSGRAYPLANDGEGHSDSFPDARSGHQSSQIKQ